MSAPLLALVLAAAAPDAGVPEKSTKSWSSADGMWAIRFVQASDGRCRVEVQKGTEPAWRLERCVGTTDDLFFVSNSGDRFWHIRALPETPDKRKGEKKAPHFRAVVAVLYDQRGKPLRTLRLEHFLARHRLGLVRQLGHHFKWLEGTLGIPGKGPRVNDQNEVELESVATKTHKLKFN